MLPRFKCHVRLVCFQRRAVGFGAPVARPAPSAVGGRRAEAGPCGRGGGGWAAWRLRAGRHGKSMYERTAVGCEMGSSECPLGDGWGAWDAPRARGLNRTAFDLWFWQPVVWGEPYADRSRSFPRNSFEGLLHPNGGFSRKGGGTEPGGDAGRGRTKGGNGKRRGGRDPLAGRRRGDGFGATVRCGCPDAAAMARRDRLAPRPSRAGPAGLLLFRLRQPRGNNWPRTASRSCARLRCQAVPKSRTNNR